MRRILKNSLVFDNQILAQEVRNRMSALNSVLQAAPGFAQQNSGMMMADSFIFGAITAVSILLVTVGVFFVLIKLGRFLDALKDKA